MENTLGELDPWYLSIWTGKYGRQVRLMRRDEKCEQIELQIVLIADLHSTLIQIHFCGPIPSIYQGAPSLDDSEKNLGIKNFYEQTDVDELDFSAAVDLRKNHPVYWGRAAIDLVPYAESQWGRWNREYNKFLRTLEEELPGAERAGLPQRRIP